MRYSGARLCPRKFAQRPNNVRSCALLDVVPVLVEYTPTRPLDSGCMSGLQVCESALRYLCNAPYCMVAELHIIVVFS